MPLLGIHDVHKFCTHRVTVGALQSLNNFPQAGVSGTQIKIAHLKYRVVVGLAELVKSKLQVWHPRPVLKTQRVKASFLMPPLAVRGNKLYHADLLPLVFSGLRIVGYCGLRPDPHFADFGELVSQHGMRNIVEADRGSLDLGQSIEIVPPLRWDCVGVPQVVLKQGLNIGSIRTGYM